MRARIVIGANFGDEGKGLVVDHLCSQGAGIVVRFNGGANAGHTVVTKDKERHVFRHFGSGSLLNVPTYLSQFFVCNPILFFIELEELRALGFHPEVYAHPDCLITTFTDMMVNQLKERSRDLKRHGSCGVGLHETMQRSKLDELKITLGDLWNGWKRRDQQMEEICGKWLQYRTGLAAGKDPDNDATIQQFIETCMDFAAYVQPLGITQVRDKDPVFEGAQGLLLSQDNKEFKPHLTHSYTGMRNPVILCEQAGIKSADVYYVSRTYLTRHGAGPLPGEAGTISYPDDTNRENEFQGKLRFAPLDPKSLLARCDADVEGGAYKLVLTHCDQCDPPKGLDAALFSDGPQRENVIAGPIV